jgi:phasin family protein
MFTKLNLNPMDMSKVMESLKIPGVNVEALLSSQQKNIEALTAANRTAVEGIQTLSQRQAEIFRRTMEEATKAAQAVATTGQPQDIPAKQAEIAKVVFEKGLANMQELAELAARANADTLEVVNKRFAESFEDLKSIFTPNK